MKIYSLILMLLIPISALTEPVDMYKLFDVVLGEKYNCLKCKNIVFRDGIPIQTFKAPFSDLELKVFYDFTVRVSTDSGLVARLEAERYFEDSAKCSIALYEVKYYLTHKYGQSQSKYPAVWERVSEDGIIDGRLSCSITEGEPYYQLQLFFTHKKQFQLINDSLKRLMNR